MKILQIMPAPTGMTAVFLSDSDEKPRKTYTLPVDCLALVVANRQRSIEAMATMWDGAFFPVREGCELDKLVCVRLPNDGMTDEDVADLAKYADEAMDRRNAKWAAETAEWNAQQAAKKAAEAAKNATPGGPTGNPNWNVTL